MLTSYHQHSFSLAVTYAAPFRQVLGDLYLNSVMLRKAVSPRLNTTACDSQQFVCLTQAHCIPLACLFAADIISAVEFDHDGLHLATGDRGGRVVLFERVNPHPVSAEYCLCAASMV